MSYICYVLRSLNPTHCNRTYVGITNNPDRRLRQHNGLLTNGARATSAIRPLTYFVKITNLTKKKALSIERSIHNMRKGKNKRYIGLVGSLLSVMYFVDRKVIKPSDVLYYGLY
jgi:predicted GIY-YIG superfamily endonuclease